MIKTFELYLILLFSKKILNIFLIFFALVFILNLFEEINFFKDLQTNAYFPNNIKWLKYACYSF